VDADRGRGTDRCRAADRRAPGTGEAGLIAAEQLERARDAAAEGAADGESVVAVLPAEPGSGALVYLVAFEGDGELTYLALDEGHQPVGDRRLVRDAVAMLALAERAEEVAGSASAEELAAALVASAAELDAGGYASVAAAAREAAARAEALDRVAQGPRVATPAYLDRLAATALELGAALAAYETELTSVGSDEAAGGAVPEHLHDAWRAAALARAAGSPAELPVLLAATTGAAEALADDVVGRYRVPLV
jgi:hypothetical protein